MGKASRRKRGSAGTAAPPPSKRPPIQTPPPLPPERGRSWWQIVKLIAFYLVGALGLIGTFVTIFLGPIWSTVQEIHLTGLNATSPFAFPFSIKNSSVIFPTRIALWTCSGDHLEIGGSSFTDYTFGRGSDVVIEPNATDNFSCGVHAPGAIVKADVFTVKATYSSFLRSGSATQSFRWIDAGQNSKWIEGKEIH
jgi:hypothetical protein